MNFCFIILPTAHRPPTFMNFYFTILPTARRPPTFMNFCFTEAGAVSFHFAKIFRFVNRILPSPGMLPHQLSQLVT